MDVGIGNCTKGKFGLLFVKPNFAGRSISSGS